MGYALTPERLWDVALTLRTAYCIAAVLWLLWMQIDLDALRFVSARLRVIGPLSPVCVRSDKWRFAPV